MTKRVSFEGKVHEFPDDASDDEIRSVLNRDSAASMLTGPQPNPGKPYTGYGEDLQGEKPSVLSRMGSGLADAWSGLTGMAGTVAKGVGNPRAAVDELLVQPFMKATHESGEAFRGGRPAMGAAKLLEAATGPVGGFIGHTAEAIGRDPVRGLTELAVNRALPMAAERGGRMVGAGLERLGAPNAATEAANLVRQAHPTPEMATERIVSESAGRTKAMQDALAQLVPETNAEVSGGKVSGAIESRLGQVKAAEKGLWDPLDAKLKNAPVDMQPLSAAATEIGAPAIEAWKRAASDLAPSTMSVLSKLSPTVKRSLELGEGPSSYAATPLVGASDTAAVSRYNQAIQSLLGEQETARPVTWEVARRIKTEIGDLKRQAKRANVIGGPDVRALTKFEAALDESMRSAAESAGVADMYETAKAATRYKYDTYGKGTTQKVLRKPGEPGKVYPSQIPGRVAKMPVEEIRRTQEAIGPNEEGRTALGEGVQGQVMESAKKVSDTGETSIVPKKALARLGTPSVREAMGEAKALELSGKITEAAKRGSGAEEFAGSPESILPKLRGKDTGVPNARRLRQFIGDDADLLKQTHAAVLEDALKQATPEVPVGKKPRLEGREFSTNWSHTKNVLKALDADPTWLSDVEQVAGKLGKQLSAAQRKRFVRLLVYGAAGAAGASYVGRHVASQIAVP